MQTGKNSLKPNSPNKSELKYLNMKILKHYGWILVTGGFCLVSFVIVSLKNDDRNFEISKQLNIYASLFRDISTLYVDETNPGDLVTSSITSMLKTLDPYTVFYPESQMEDVKLMTTGEYAGIGSLISKKGDDIVIREPYKNAPADKAGLVPGDIILSLDGNPIKDKTVSDVSEILKGQPGKEIVVTIRREGEAKPIDKKIIREKIQLPDVPYYGMAKGNVGYVYLNGFTDKASTDVRKAVLDLKAKGAEAMILDLRGNGGGLLEEAVEICNLFLPKGTKILNTRGKVKQWDKEYTTAKNPIAPDMPLAVLIDRSSASSSEIVAGALQDYDRAVLVGERSFGKGLVQTVRDLVYNTKIKVTTAKYYIPSGRCVQALDYSHRNPDGSVGKVPDSLITEFTTAAGRKVYDGGGVTPDIKVEPQEYARITEELVLRDICFDFVNSYALKHPTAAPVAEFAITDEMYRDFGAYLKEKNFSYETDSKQILTELIKAAKEEKFYEADSAQLEALKKSFTHSIDRDVDLFREEITSFLAEQFVQRYYYASGVVEYKVSHDPEVAKAILVLNDKAEYQKILRP